MKLVIDDQPAEATESPEAPLRDVVERISNELREHNRVISEIYLDGEAIVGYDDPKLSQVSVGQCQHLRLISREPRRLAIEVLREIVKYMPRIQSALVQASSQIQARQEEEGLQTLQQITQTWSELLAGLQNAMQVTGIELQQIYVGEKTFAAINEEVHTYLDEVSQLVEEGQLLELSDILEYELAPRLPLIEEAIYHVIREAERPPSA